MDTIDYEVIVEKEVEVEEVSIQGLLGNLTQSCNSLVETTNICFGYIAKSNNCSSELSTTEEERGTYKTKWEDSDGTLVICKSEKAELEREKTELTNQVVNRITRNQCNNQTASAVSLARKENESKSNQTLGLGALGALGFWLWQKKKKGKSTVADSYYYDKS